MQFVTQNYRQNCIRWSASFKTSNPRQQPSPRILYAECMEQSSNQCHYSNFSDFLQKTTKDIYFRKVVHGILVCVPCPRSTFDYATLICTFLTKCVCTESGRVNDRFSNIITTIPLDTISFSALIGQMTGIISGPFPMVLFVKMLRKKVEGNQLNQSHLENRR